MFYLSCSPYMYLQMLYQYQGYANKGNETLITIDEPQNVSYCEYELIMKLNDNKVIFNLFGDVKQHIEGTKFDEAERNGASFVEFQLYKDSIAFVSNISKRKSTRRVLV